MNVIFHVPCRGEVLGRCNADGARACVLGRQASFQRGFFITSAQGLKNKGSTMKDVGFPVRNSGFLIFLPIYILAVREI